MTLQEILTAVYDETGFDTSPPDKVQRRMIRWVNEGMRAVLGSPGLERLVDSDTPFTVASTTNTTRLVIPEAAARILSVTERTTNTRLTALSMQAYRALQPNPTQSIGSPTHYVPLGRTAVAVQPSDASAIYIKSDSNSDITAAFLEGLLTGGYRRKVSVTMTGTTAVQFDALTTCEVIEDVYLDAPAVGTVTVLEDSGVGTELARITIGQRRPEYFAMLLWPTPASPITYYIDYHREAQELVNPGDEPVWSRDYHEMLVAYTVYREREHKADVERAAIAKARFDKSLSRLKYATQTTGDELAVQGRGMAIGHSRLGAYYPADTWTRG